MSSTISAGFSAETLPINPIHLRRLTGPFGIYEHAEFDHPRLEHGTCVDDNARVLVVLSSDAGLTELPLYRIALNTVVDGWTADGWRNRRSFDGTWHGVGTEDCHGRALWGLSCHLSNCGDDPAVSRVLRAGFKARPTSPRAIAFGILGGSAVLEHPEVGREAQAFIEWGQRLPRLRTGSDWPWPEPKLAYSNARWADALMRLGQALDDEGAVADGLAMLAWLVSSERVGEDRFSFTPSVGRGPNEVRIKFDQQPLEAWSMLGACRRAEAITGMSEWGQLAAMARDWFFGRNDHHIWMYDPRTGAGFDGLTLAGRNENAGAESTLAATAAVMDLSRS